jgi:hypothetical protein
MKRYSSLSMQISTDIFSFGEVQEDIRRFDVQIRHPTPNTGAVSPKALCLL